MILLRLVTTSLCAACVVLLVTFKPVQLVMRSAALPAESGPCVLERVQSLTVIDVAAGVTAPQLGELLRLYSGERIIAVNDHRLAADVVPANVIAALQPEPGGFIDLTVAGTSAERRVLVLLH